MLIGLAGGLLPADINRVDEPLAARLQELGFGGLTVHFGSNLYLSSYAGSFASPDDLPTKSCRQARSIFDAYGIRIVQSWGFGANFVHPDEATRRRQVEIFAGAARVAADLGADSVNFGCGSLNMEGLYWPHRDNHSPATRERLVRSLREAAGPAEHHGVRVALEPHVLTTLTSPERVREILEQVDSPWVGVNLDPVNFVGSLEQYYDTAGIVDRMFDSLDHLSWSGHLKDVRVKNGFVLHLDEVVPGDGEFALEHYLRRFAETKPDAYLAIEHLAPDDVSRAKLLLDGLLARVGVAA